MKALVWEDEAARVWIGYLDPGTLAERHGSAACPGVENLRNVLSDLTSATVQP